MDPLRMIIAIVPLALYLLWIGFLNLRSRPTVMSGVRDSMTLGISLLGLVLIGPLELLLPESTAFRFGAYAWVMLGSFYMLSLVLSVMMGRPRIVIYNSDLETVRPALSQAVRSLDEQARWAGDSVVLPSVGVQLYMDRYAMLRNVQLKSVGSAQSFTAWVKLEKELRKELKLVKSERGAAGSLFVMFAGALFAIVAMAYLRDQGEIARTFKEMLHR